MVKQLIYKSHSVRDISIDFIEDILISASLFNDAHSITGLLLYNQNTFIQFIEGEPDHVNSLYDRIFRDRRHLDIQTLYTGYSDTRFYPFWSMAALCADRTLKSPILEVYVADQSRTCIELRDTKIEIESLIQGFSKAYLPEAKPGRNLYN